MMMIFLGRWLVDDVDGGGGVGRLTVVVVAVTVASGWLARL